MRTYSGDPYWLTARYNGRCAGCGAPIRKGNEGFYYPRGKKLYGRECGCGERESRSFQAAAFDESVMSGEW